MPTTTKKTARKLPTPLYDAAGAGELAYHPGHRHGEHPGEEDGRQEDRRPQEVASARHTTPRSVAIMPTTADRDKRQRRTVRTATTAASRRPTSLGTKRRAAAGGGWRWL